MRNLPGFAEKFFEDIKKIPKEIRDSVNRQGGLNEDDLVRLTVLPRDNNVHNPTPPGIDDVSPLERDFLEGETAIDSGQVAFAILAGGAGTRIGAPKSLLKIPGTDVSLLGLKIRQATGKGPVWIIVNPSTKKEVEDHVKGLKNIDLSRITFVEQYNSYRLSPDNSIIFADGVPSLYPCGHGDLFPAITHQGILKNFLSSGGKHVMVVNVDNVLASLDARVVTQHIKNNANVTCEVVKKNPEDSGGFLCDTGTSLQIVESFRISGVDLNEYTWLNTNTMTFKADIDVSPLGNSWHRIRKIVENKIVIQYERMLQEITAAYDSQYISVEREERFMPIKSIEDLLKASQILNTDKRLFDPPA
jgi:UTP--glucose-1-phosphate uridylyltransferase